tara:strand:+ start:982 stop:1227 length:246 start_codon:yes stop_codon:yes gene_type:complete
MRITEKELRKIVQDILREAEQQAYVGDVAVDVSDEEQAQMLRDKIAADTADEKTACKPGPDSSQCKSDHDEIDVLQKARST